MTLVTNPYPIFLDGRGMLLDGGSIYIGLPNTDPTILVNRILLYQDAAYLTVIANPLKTLGGVIVNGRNKIFVHTPATDYSIAIKDAQGDTVYSIASINFGGVAYQPLSDNLTAISAATQTAFGRSLLELPNAEALRAATGIPNCLPLAGGIVTANITRGGAGPHIYHVDLAMTSGRMFPPVPIGTADATSLPGDIQLFY
jgi:Head binding